jgi:hypothetical protein
MEVTMAMERNGVIFMSDEEARDPSNPANKAVREVHLGDVKFPFGFFIKEKAGKKFVVPATFQDKLKVMRLAFPDFPDDPDDPIRTGSCFDPDSIDRGCGKLEGFICVKISHPHGGFFDCGCISGI